MPEPTRSVNSGLDAPARRRRTEQGAGAGIVNGTPQSEGGIAQPTSGIESASAEPERIGSGFPIIDPLNIPGDGTASSNQSGKRRGRPRGSTNKKEETVRNLASLAKVERILVLGAFFLGNIADTPEFYMEPEQARGIRESIEELCRLYPIGLSEKKIAWTNFSFEVGGWLVPGIVALWKKKPERIKPSVASVREEAAEPFHGASSPVAPEAAQVPSQLWSESGVSEET